MDRATALTYVCSVVSFPLEGALSVSVSGMAFISDIKADGLIKQPLSICCDLLPFLLQFGALTL